MCSGRELQILIRGFTGRKLYDDNKKTDINMTAKHDYKHRQRAGA